MDVGSMRCTFLSRQWVCTLVFMVWCLPAPLQAQSQKLPSEYEIKAAWLIKFLKFVDWPPEAMARPDLTIYIIGKDPDERFFDYDPPKYVKGKQVTVKHHRRFRSDLSFEDAHMIFIARSERKSVDDVLATVAGTATLMVSEVPDFIEQDGMINFVTRGKVIRFDINQRASSRNGLRIHSDLLRRAINVVRKNSE
jgi:hypothetical protein